MKYRDLVIGQEYEEYEPGVGNSRIRITSMEIVEHFDDNDSDLVHFSYVWTHIGGIRENSLTKEGKIDTSYGDVDDEIDLYAYEYVISEEVDISDLSELPPRQSRAGRSKPSRRSA